MRVVLPALLVCFYGSAHPRPPDPAIPWTNIVWQAIDFGGAPVAHAAMLVEVRLDGMKTPARMQLDTGCDSNLLYGAPYRELARHDPALGRNQFALSGTAAASRFSDERFFVQNGSGGSWLGVLLTSLARHWNRSTDPPLLGTLGAPFFEQRVLLLDLVSQRVAILRYGEELPAFLARRCAFAPLAYRNAKLFVNLRINGETERYLAYDSGSSSMALVTSRRRWLEWTGRQPADPRNRTLQVPSWGKEVALYGAPLMGAMCVGNACLTAPLAFFEPTGLKSFDFDRYPFPMDGVFGNVAFDGRFTVVLDVPHGRFGLAQESLAVVAR